MEITNINLTYFSATYTTRKIIRLFGEQFKQHEIFEHDLTRIGSDDKIEMTASELLVIGIPVYAGRIPELALSKLDRLKGNNTPSVIMVVYGNRDYDDALLELKNTVEGKGFKTIAAGAFVAQHSIFPQVGHNRPDEKDKETIRNFAEHVTKFLSETTDINTIGNIKVKGNFPYKIPGKVPLKPEGNSKCDSCGTCVKLCLTAAIPEDKPRKTDNEKCISCGRCIVVCPQHARNFGGLLYKMANRKFIKAYSDRKEPEYFYL